MMQTHHKSGAPRCFSQLWLSCKGGWLLLYNKFPSAFMLKLDCLKWIKLNIFYNRSTNSILLFILIFYSWLLIFNRYLIISQLIKRTTFEFLEIRMLIFQSAYPIKRFFFAIFLHWIRNITFFDIAIYFFCYEFSLYQLRILKSLFLNALDII